MFKRPRVSLHKKELLFTIVSDVLCRLAKLYAIHTLGEAQGAKAFITTLHCRAQIDKHERLAITT